MNQVDEIAESTLTGSDSPFGGDSGGAPRSGRHRRKLWWVAIFLLFLVVFYRPPPVGPPAGWGDDLESALAQAKTSGRLVVVAFHGAHCPPCHVMDRTVLGKPPVQKALAGYVPVRIDPEQHLAVAQKYQIFATPAYVVLNADGLVVNQILGSRSVEGFVAFLDTSRGLAANTPTPGT